MELDAWLGALFPVVRQAECRLKDQRTLLPRQKYLLPMIRLSPRKLTCSRLCDLVLTCITLASTFGVNLAFPKNPLIPD